MKLATLYKCIAILVLAIFGLSACKKNGGDATGNDEKYLTCKLNGEYHEFNYGVSANDKPATDIVHFLVVGGYEKQDMIKGFGIDLTLPSDGIKEKTYIVSGTTSISLHGKYYIQNMKDGKIVGTTGYNGGTSAGTNFTLTITSLTAWGVKGTFSGKLQLVGGNDYVTVTEGKFSAPYN